MQPLAFPAYDFRFKSNENKTSIFDPIRKKFVHFTPEEWVRQHCIRFLLEDRKIPASLMNVEKQLRIHGIQKRYDIVVYRPNGAIALLVECKAPTIALNQDTFDQIARYNLALNASYLMLTNGLQHIYCTLDYQEETYHFLREIPQYTLL